MGVAERYPTLADTPKLSDGAEKVLEKTPPCLCFCTTHVSTLPVDVTRSFSASGRIG